MKILELKKYNNWNGKKSLEESILDLTGRRIITLEERLTYYIIQRTEKMKKNRAAEQFRAQINIAA